MIPNENMAFRGGMGRREGSIGQIDAPTIDYPVPPCVILRADQHRGGMIKSSLRLSRDRCGGACE
ncbi:hypothetical protein RB3802 [Rhodopirellula baltica SH 1]|uniref:Uncharacterized protein n=1 Tax=Rhodopirellula baltica (strain DSM 10527 / NCIMB 13988 / SH1) TaxID=243090 RepID=Q7UTM1_RHOBA|nr:hypothetical protein RB3802 [Rhodopirellula baltica SH 1]